MRRTKALSVLVICFLGFSARAESSVGSAPGELSEESVCAELQEASKLWIKRYKAANDEYEELVQRYQSEDIDKSLISSKFRLSALLQKLSRKMKSDYESLCVEVSE